MTVLTTAAALALAAQCGPGVDPHWLVGIAQVESGLNSAAISEPNKNGSRDYGITQINDTNFALLGIDAKAVMDPCVAFGAQALLLKLLSAYNTGSPTRGIRNGYAGLAFQAIRATRGTASAAVETPTTRTSAAALQQAYVDIESGPAVGEIIFTTRDPK